MKAHLFAWLVLAGAAFWIGLRAFERAMIFIPSRDVAANPGTMGLQWEPLWLAAKDGVRLRAWFIPGPRKNVPVMLCLHGNAGNLSDRAEKMRIFHDAGASQLWIDWRGYGESSGSPDEPGLYRDALAAYAWLTAAKAVPASRLVLYGESLGCGPAVELAASVPAAALIVDSGFTSVPDMAREVLPWLPRALVQTSFDNLSKLPRVRLPTLFLHSPQDDIIPYEMARRNFAAAGGPKRLVDLRGGHNEGFLDSQPAYGAAIKGFLDENF